MTTRSNAKTASNLNSDLMQTLDKKFDEFKIQFLEKSFAVFKNTIVEVIKKEFKVEIDELKKKVKYLEGQLENSEQYNRANNLLISGVPENKNENIYDILCKISVTAGCKITREDVDFASRISPRVNQNATNGKQRNIIVKFTHRYLKDDLLAAIKKRKGMFVSDLQLPGAGRIYLNEHLTPKNQHLLKQCKDIKKDKKILYCWVRNCKVYIRVSDTSPRIYIADQDDVTRLLTLKTIVTPEATTSSVPLGN